MLNRSYSPFTLDTEPHTCNNKRITNIAGTYDRCVLCGKFKGEKVELKHAGGNRKNGKLHTVHGDQEPEIPNGLFD